SGGSTGHTSRQASFDAARREFWVPNICAASVAGLRIPLKGRFTPTSRSSFGLDARPQPQRSSRFRSFLKANRPFSGEFGSAENHGLRSNTYRTAKNYLIGQNSPSFDRSDAIRDRSQLHPDIAGQRRERAPVIPDWRECDLLS